MTDWIANGESGSSIRAKLNALVPASPAINIVGTSPTFAPWQFILKPFGLLTADGFSSDWVWWLNRSFTDAAFDLSGVQELELANIGGVGGDFVFTSGSDPALVSISAPSLVIVEGNLYVTSLQVDADISLPRLKVVTGEFAISNVTALEYSPYLSALTSVGSSFAFIGNTSIITAPDLSQLQHVGSFLAFTGNSAMTDTPDFSSLVLLYSDLYFDDNALLPTAPDFSSLTSVVIGLISIQRNYAMTGVIDFSGCRSFPEDITIKDNSLLTGISFSPSLRRIASNVVASGNALTEASVDAILVAIASLDGTGGTTSWDNLVLNLSGGTNSPPSDTGLTAKATLEGRGNTVTVNS